MPLLKNIFNHETSSGILLFLAAMLAMLFANTNAGSFYQGIIHYPLFNYDLLYVVNNGLMVIFFLVISLELKREVIEGELSDIKQVLLPAFAALGGMIIPALIYLAFNYSHPETSNGWAIPVATDIAFALGVLSLFGKRIPYSLKLFLMSLAIFDDLGAIIIIAFFHSHDFSFNYLLLAGLIFILLSLLNYTGVRNVLIYLLVGIVFWFCMLNSGIHPTIAGVIVGLIIPVERVHLLEVALQPWVSFIILPVFAFANAGFSLAGLGVNQVFDYVTLGIFCGLFFGKQIGVFSFSWIAIKTKFATLPNKSSWRQLYGVALLCGIGFTMSLFLGALTFGESSFMNEVKLGVLSASSLSALMGALLLLKGSD